MFGLAEETLSEQQAARTVLEPVIAAPGSLQQGRGILHNLAGTDLTARAAAKRADPGHHQHSTGSHHTRAALILAAAIIWSNRMK
jgi:ubiquinone biosynthesis protein